MIFPKPMNEEVYEGTYKTKSNYEIFSLIDFYRFIKDGNEDIEVSLLAGLESEEYIIVISDEGIQITASGDVGVYRAATSLLQMINRYKGKLPHCKVDDKPQLAHRGYMLDISRCRKPKMETIKNLIDFLSNLKYNEFQLYMEGDCFKYSELPEYNCDYDCLGAKDFEALDKYCAERFIDFIPNQNSLGHLSPWLVKEEFKHLGVSDGTCETSTINPLLPESVDFIDKLYESVLPHCRSDYFNIGLDEAFELGKYQTEDYCKKHGKEVAFMEWLNKLADLVRDKYGKKVMLWGDMFHGDSSVYKMIPKDATVMEWGYELIQSQQMTEYCMNYQNAGIRYYTCPSCNTHLSFTGRFDVTSFNIRTAAELAVKFGAVGMMMTDWGCNEGHPHFWVWSAVPIALAGQYAWNTGKEQDGETFKADFIRNAEKYVDGELFDGKGISRLLYRMANYYLLEPERVHVGSICGELLKKSIDVTNFEYFYDIKDFGDAFYFDNVTEYVSKILADIEKIDFNNQYKREIILNSKMVILSSEICKIRIGIPADKKKIDELVSLIDWIKGEYYELWCNRNFEKGVEEFMMYLTERKKEILSLTE